MTRATAIPPDLETRGFSYLFMSFPRSFAFSADLIHFLVRKKVEEKLNTRMTATRTTSSISTTKLSIKHISKNMAT